MSQVRVSSRQISSGAADVLRHVTTPNDEGWWDLTNVRLAPNRGDLHSPLLCNGAKQVALPIAELAKVSAYLGFMYPENCNNVAWILLMGDQVQVFWRGGGVCLILGVEKRHLEVLTLVRESMSFPKDREEIGVSFTDTILTLADIYGCQGEHKRSCPVEGDRTRSLIAPNGEVKTVLLTKLRGFGLARDSHE